MKFPIFHGTVLPLALAAAQVARAESDSDSLCAYGIDMGGLPLIYADGITYLGAAPSNSSTSTNVTVSVSSGGLTVSSTENTWFDSKNLFINTRTGAYAAAKIASSATGYTSTGFMFYGRTLFLSGSSGMTSLFYAAPVDSHNETYVLKWNSDSKDDGISTPVALRTLPPS